MKIQPITPDIINTRVGPDGSMTLVSLKDGNRWRDPIKVKTRTNITIDEFIELIGIGTFDGDIKDFTLIRENNKYTIVA